MLSEVLLSIAVGALLFLLMNVWRKPDILKTKDGWWGVEERPEGQEDVTIRPFQLSTSDAELEDLHRRIDQTRPVPSLHNSQFNYGFNSEYLQKVISYWRNDFDWRKQVEKINQFPHFKTNIEGLDVHYVHVKPQVVPQGTKVIPLIMVHGWPGSFYEFYGVIPLLTQLSQAAPFVFEVVCPSIPGYGFSEAPHQKGFDSVCAARIFHKLMKRLGFSHFYAQGGDWGWLVTTNMAQLEPRTVTGLHLNFAPPSKPGLLVTLSVLLGKCLPKLFNFTSMDLEKLYPAAEKLLVEPVLELGYMHIQATKPDSVDLALTSMAHVDCHFLITFQTEEIGI